jgi:hypothetical protein
VTRHSSNPQQPAQSLSLPLGPGLVRRHAGVEGVRQELVQHEPHEEAINQG